LDHRTTFRSLGIAIIVGLGLGISVFQAYGGRSVVESLYEIFILAIGGLGAIAIQMVFWPERFVPRPAQLTNPLLSERPVPVQNLRPLSEGETFESGLLPHQRMFHRGDPVLFWARFKGKLIDGYLGTYIKKPDGTFAATYDYSTVVNTLTGKGRLNGENVNIESRWSWMIPMDCTAGRCHFFIHAGNHFPPSSMWVRLKALAIHILWPSRVDFAKGTNQAIVGNWEVVDVVE
jgi:hypothetical protein